MPVYTPNVTERQPLKRCYSCKESIPRTEENFSRNKSRPDGLDALCKACAAARWKRWYESADYDGTEKARQWRANNLEKSNASLLKSRLKNKFGLSVEEYEQMMVDQDEKCAACGDLTKLCVDHCHLTGRVRGLLCASCNKGLGMFQDNPERLRRAASYLEG